MWVELGSSWALGAGLSVGTALAGSVARVRRAAPSRWSSSRFSRVYCGCSLFSTYDRTARHSLRRRDAVAWKAEPLRLKASFSILVGQRSSTVAHLDSSRCSDGVLGWSRSCPFPTSRLQSSSLQSKPLTSLFLLLSLFLYHLHVVSYLCYVYLFVF